MSQMYNKDYYIDIFKFLLEKKLIKSTKKDSFILNDSLMSQSIFPINSAQIVKNSKNFLSKNLGREKSAHQLHSTDFEQNEVINTRRIKARLYNENVYEKMLEMKKKRENYLLEKKKFIENQWKTKQEKFQIALKKSQRALSEKILKNAKKSEINFERAQSNRMRNRAILESKMQQIV